MEKNKVDFHLIQESKSSDIDKLFDVYRKDPRKARVLYFNDKNKYTQFRLVLFKKGNKDFEIVWFKKSVGISKTNRIYSRQKKVQSLIYKGGKFYLINTNRSSGIVQLTWNGLSSFVSNFTTWSEAKSHPIITSLFKKFSWMRFVSENSILHNVSFNSITRYKLYNLNDALKHLFKVPLPVVKNLMIMFKDYSSHDSIKIWKEMKDVLINVENLKPELFRSHIFMDTCKMARTLDKKVNCSWGEKRLKLEHDEWSKEITNTVLEFEDERQLNVAEIFIIFSEYSGYKLLKSNKDLLREGMTQKHCVGTYINRVDNGGAGIYHINGYTLELCFERVHHFTNFGGLAMSTNNKYLKNVQFRGYRNCCAPNSLYETVNGLINSFNYKLATEKYKDNHDVGILDDLNQTQKIQGNLDIQFNDLNLNPDVIDFDQLF